MWRGIEELEAEMREGILVDRKERLEGGGECGRDTRGQTGRG